MARMTLDELLRRNVVGGQVFDPLSQRAGLDQWQFWGGTNESGQAVGSGVADPSQLAALQGYTFDWQDTGPANTGTLTVYDPSGAQVGSFDQSDQTTGSALGEWLALAGAGFGGLGLAGFGPLGGLGQSLGFGAVDPGAGAGLAEVGTFGGAGIPDGAGIISGGGGMTAGGASGAGITAPTLGQTAGIGAGLGMTGAAGGAGGAAAGGSFWGGLAKAAIGPALSAGTQLIAGNQAAKAQQAATTQANNLQRYVYDTTRADNMPALQARNSALEQMQSLLKDPSSLTSQPGYRFGMDEGTRALNNGAAARGMTYSGAQGKALQRFGQDYAGTKLDGAFSRLSALASSGQTGAGTIANAGQNYGNTVGNNLTAQGDANAARYIVGGNAIGNGINSLTAYGQRQGWWGG